MSRNTDPDKGWVRVEDAMPEDDEEVIVFTSGKTQYFAFYDDEGEWRDQVGDPFMPWPSVITHWRNPFPPPKEGE